MSRYDLDEMSAFHDKALACALGILKDRDRLAQENAELREQLRLRDEFAQQRTAVEESRPPLSVGKPCPKCGQKVG
jgi:hypothetical protein